MARRLGLDPLAVTSALGRLELPLGAVDGIADDLERAWFAVADAFGFAATPMGLIISAGSIGSMRSAVVDIRAASELARGLIEAIRGHVDEQVGTSSATGASYRISASRRQSWQPTLLQVWRDPTLLLGLGIAARTAFFVARTDAESRALAAAAPGLIGSLDGAPYWCRDTANRLQLDRFLGEPGLAGARAEAAAAIQDAIRSAEARGVAVELVALHLPDGDERAMRAVIGIGRLDDAEAITVLVPGMDSSVSASVQDLSGDALSLMSEERAVDPRVRTAVVAWLGYEAPDALTVGGEVHAIRGGANLTAFLDGVDAMNEDARVTIAAHSYGGRVATYALSGGAHSDALVLFGTPGVAEPVISARMLAASEVYGTKSTADQQPFDLIHWDEGIASLGQGVSALDGRRNADPIDPAFGAVVYRVRDPDGHGLSYETAQKQGYLSPGTDSLRALALIGLGRGDEVG